MSKYVSKYDKRIRNEKIDPVTKFVIGSKEYNAYYNLENYIENKGRRR